MQHTSKIKYLVLGLLLLPFVQAFSQTATVTIEVTWADWAEENRVQIRDITNSLPPLIEECVPGNCYVSNGARIQNYTNTVNIVLNYGGYILALSDLFNDGWNGASSVRILVDGVQVINTTKANNGNETDFFGFSVFDTSVPQNQPLTIFDQFNGFYDYAVTAKTLRTSAVDPCAITTTSSNGLTTTIPAGATIEKAYLFWAHSNYTADTSVTFEGQVVTADVVNQYAISQISFFGMVSDVTTIIQGIPDPSTNTYDFSDLNIDNTNNTGFYCGSTTLGGWSLMIFYTEPSLPPSRINLYNGFNGLQNANANFTIDNFFAISSAGAKTTVLSWEGDQAFAGGEDISITTNTNPVPSFLKGDGDNIAPTENPFNSTIFDNSTGTIVNDNTSYGVDLDTYNISSFIAPGDSSVATNVDVGGDIVLLNAVAIKVTSNLIVGTVFEDINYPGGVGRDLTAASGAPIENARVELYDSSGNLELITTTDNAGEYVFAGMTDGDYSVRVVNNTVRSTRAGGAACTTCFPIQTFRRNYTTGSITDVANEIGGVNPATEDPGAVTTIGNPIPAGAQTVSSVSIMSAGAVDLDFGFNFNTIINTNESGQGSLEQFIVNSNALDETGINIEANSAFDPPANQDVSIFMIPISDANFNGTYYDIFISDLATLSPITDNRTHIDGRTQRGNFTNSNTGSIISAGTIVGTSANSLPAYPLPEIQVHRNNGDVFTIQDTGVIIRDLSIYANDNAGIVVDTGAGADIRRNLIGVNAAGVAAGNIDYGVEIIGGTADVFRNYIAQNTVAGVLVNGGTSTAIRQNYITANGGTSCNDNITISSGAGVTIETNFIQNASAFGIDDMNGNVIIRENTITTSGQDIITCTDNEGIQLGASNSQVTNNIINANGGAGVILTGGTTTANLISQNSIFANGVTFPALGIDINDDGVTINDLNDADSGPNGSINFPIFESVAISGTSLRVVGWARPGAVIEFFVTDINEGTSAVGDNQIAGPSGAVSQDYGEGQIYIGSGTEGGISDNDGTATLYNVTDGNTDNTNRFNFLITLSTAIPPGSIITATSTVANSTSEFGNTYTIGSARVITNRRTTYRVRRN